MIYQILICLISSDKVQHIAVEMVRILSNKGCYWDKEDFTIVKFREAVACR